MTTLAALLLGWCAVSLTLAFAWAFVFSHPHGDRR